VQLKVIKTDGAIEEYLHTKVLGTFSNALALIDQTNVFAAEQFAEAITYYLYQKRGADTITSDEIHLMVQAVLSATGYENAAKALNEYQLNRKLQRARIEVIQNGCAEYDDLDMMLGRWSKSKIVEGLVRKNHLDLHIARVIASTVEQKVLGLGMTKIKCSLIKQLVMADTDTILKAQEQLLAVAL
jgi:transcriptional regulator NrdR family protein